MKSVDLNAIPYKLRFNAASLLISKANKLCGLISMDSTARPDQKALLSAIAYYDMALALQKPYDPNYSTVVNWKCNVLREIGQYEDAVSWYREIIRLSDETNGPEMRDATAKLAEEMIRDCGGRPNEPLAVEMSGEADFDDPPYCMFAIEFCELLADQKFKKAHSYLSPTLKERVSLKDLSAHWKQMTQDAKTEELVIDSQQRMVDWPTRKTDDVGWCYLSVSTAEVNEAITVVVGRTPHHSFWITDLEFGRP